MYIDLETLEKVVRLAHDPRRTTPRRIAFTDSMLALWTVVTGVNYLGTRLDDLRFGDYHDTPLGQPIYIVAAPRSGTTFLHRLMSLDPQFTALRMYETILHSLSTQKVLESLAKPGPMRKAFERVIGAIDDRYFGGWEGKHDTGVTQHEEDEALWALAMATPAIWLAFPEPEALSELRFIDAWPEDKQQKLADYYRGALQRHLYKNPGKTLLGKNVFLPGRFHLVQKAVPGARFVHVIRHPYEALPSMLSLFTMPWRYTAPGVSQSGSEALALADLMIDYYKAMHEEDLRSRAAGEHSFATVRYDQLLADPEGAVKGIYDHLQIELTPQFERSLHAAVQKQRSFNSRHTYSLEQYGLTRERVYERLREVFEHHGFAS